jgi:hypothetical protein
MCVQALTPLTIGRNRAAASALGALWGFGHSTGQLILGLVFVVLKVRCSGACARHQHCSASNSQCSRSASTAIKQAGSFWSCWLCDAQGEQLRVSDTDCELCFASNSEAVANQLEEQPNRLV